MSHRYSSDGAFRTALEQRLRTQAGETGRPLERLRKEVAHHRLLARLVEAAPPNTWALKGGLALLARLDDRARATSDADATWRSTHEELERTLDTATSLDLGDGFDLRIGRPRPLSTETEHGGLRHPVLARLAGREFEQINLDVNLVPADMRRIEQVTLRDILAFADVPAPTVPAVPLGQQLAEKIHAYTRRYGNGSSRPRDLYDMLVIAERLPIPSSAQLATDCRETFRMRDTSWPPTIKHPPQQWVEAWEGLVTVYRIPWSTLDAAGDALLRFWRPIVDADRDRRWNPDTWEWNR